MVVAEVLATELALTSAWCAESGQAVTIHAMHTIDTAERRAALVFGAILGIVGACGAAPQPTPGDMTSVLSELATHGATVSDIVAGDAGCTDPTLHDNATRLELTLADDGRPYTVYLFRWRRQTDYDGAAVAFNMCVSQYVATAGAVGADVIDVSPWRAFGPAWTKEMHDAVQQSLAAAAVGE
jgi:hypothetical protein